MKEDLSSLTGALGQWLAEKIKGSRNLEIFDALEPSQGFSSRTILVNVRWEAVEETFERGLAVRLQREVSNPLLANVFHQCEVMKVASAAGDVLVPAPVWTERSSATLGAPFFVMERASGMVPSDFPSYHLEGWVAELLPERRERTWWNGIRAMERLHAIDWHAFGSLAKGLEGQPDSRFYLDRFIRPWLDWAAQGRRFPEVEQALELLVCLAPPAERAGLVWNDARMGNVMFGQEGDVSALFDFEVASLGPAEIDLAWWLYADDIFSEGFGLDRLPGIPHGGSAIAGFEKIYGHAMPHFEYYLAIAALKHAVISIRDYSNDKLVDDSGVRADFALGRLSMHLDNYRSSIGS